MVQCATPIHTAELLRRLAEDSCLVHDDVVQNDFLDSDDDADDTSADFDSPLLDGYFESGGSDAVVTLTNFTLTEFHLLWAHVEPELTRRWASGRGRKSTTTVKDAFMMFLCVLKHYGNWQKHTIDFGFKVPTFEKMMYRILEIITPVLIIAFICPPSMATQRANSSTFRHYPYARLERLIEDNGEGTDQYQEAWAILADKGYQDVSSDRELVENFFGRVCLLWKIMHTDSEHTRRASIQRRYCRRRDARIAPDQNIRTRLSFSPSFSP
ncbi:hypothetical protein PC121_g7093 [Phytophthora cactorum]|nr:hypothetical protein PC121_g7093 [Phytophthora cactorum]